MDKKRFSSKFIFTIVGLAWHGHLVKYMHFIGSWELETNDLLKPPIAQTLNNPMNVFYDESWWAC